MAMGFPPSPILYNICMAKLEKETRLPCYVDNTFILWNLERDNPKQFLSQINKQNLAIQFTIKSENPGSLSFLGVTV